MNAEGRDILHQAYRDHVMAQEPASESVNAVRDKWIAEAQARGQVIAEMKRTQDALIEALKALSNLYTHAWDIVDGGLMMMPETGVKKFEAAHKKAAAVLSRVSP